MHTCIHTYMPRHRRTHWQEYTYDTHTHTYTYMQAYIHHDIHTSCSTHTSIQSRTSHTIQHTTARANFRNTHNNPMQYIYIYIESHNTQYTERHGQSYNHACIPTHGEPYTHTYIQSGSQPARPASRPTSQAFMIQPYIRKGRWPGIHTDGQSYIDTYTHNNAQIMANMLGMSFGIGDHVLGIHKPREYT